MDLEVVSYIYVDIDGIIEDNNLNAHSSKQRIEDAIDDYVCGLDDCEYCLIGEKEAEKIYKEIRNRVGKQTSLFEDAE